MQLRRAVSPVSQSASPLIHCVEHNLRRLASQKVRSSGKETSRKDTERHNIIQRGEQTETYTNLLYSTFRSSCSQHFRLGCRSGYYRAFEWFWIAGTVPSVNGTMHVGAVQNSYLTRLSPNSGFNTPFWDWEMLSVARIVDTMINTEFSARCFPGQTLPSPISLRR